MDNKLIMSILIFLMILSLVPASFADDDREYYINGADIDVYVLENGLLHIKETFDYEFDGAWNGIYRDIPLITGTGKKTLIENLNVKADGAYVSKKEISIDGDNNEHIKIYLSSRPDKQVKIRDCKVKVSLDYDFVNQTNIYNDIAEVHYKPWGDGWEKRVPKVTARFHLQSKDSVEYWVNPSYFKGKDYWKENTLTIETTNINAGEWFELRILIPKTQFDTNPQYANIIHQDGKEKLKEIQKKDAEKEAYQTKLYNLLAICFFASLIIPFLVYLFCGREPKIDYEGEYERELPTDDSPATVNALTSVGITGVGTPDMNGFKATVMDLINRGYFILEQASFEDDTIIRFSDKDYNDLSNSEKIIYNLFKRYSYNGEFSLNDFSDKMLNEINAKDYRNIYSNWVDSVKNNDIMDKNNNMFNGTGNILIGIYAILGLLVAALFFFVTMNNSLPAANTLFFVSIIFGIICIICLGICFIFPTVAGRWTKEGRTYNAKWTNFKKYLTDFSMIKEYPPESVTVWNHYLVYATALGVADKVSENMKMYLPPEELDYSDTYRFHYYGGYAILSTSMNHGATTGVSDSSSGGGFGGSGGGGGGGGGGAF